MTPDPHQEHGLTLRDPATVMRLERLGALHQSRLSFMRILTRRMTREAWRFTRPVFDIDANITNNNTYKLKKVAPVLIELTN